MSERPSNLAVPAAIVLGACIIAFGLYEGLKARAPAEPNAAPTPAQATAAPSVCIPAKSCPSSLQCDKMPDGCGGFVDCGVCPAGKTCKNGACAPAN